MRNLEREIDSICRKVARKVVVEGKGFQGDRDAESGSATTSGVPRFRLDACAEEKNEIGIATGLAWTEVGGEILVDRGHAHAGQGPS